jgi:hypothetical protein
MKRFLKVSIILAALWVITFATACQNPIEPEGTLWSEHQSNAVLWSENQSNADLWPDNTSNAALWPDHHSNALLWPD